MGSEMCIRDSSSKEAEHPEQILAWGLNDTNSVVNGWHRHEYGERVDDGDRVYIRMDVHNRDIAKLKDAAEDSVDASRLQDLIAKGWDVNLSPERPQWFRGEIENPGTGKIYESEERSVARVIRCLVAAVEGGK